MVGVVFFVFQKSLPVVIKADSPKKIHSFFGKAFKHAITSFGILCCCVLGRFACLQGVYIQGLVAAGDGEDHQHCNGCHAADGGQQLLGVAVAGLQGSLGAVLVVLLRKGIEAFLG